jgi:hypothetical protein
MKKSFVDFFFVFQVVLAIIFGTNQFMHMLHTSMNGLSTSTFLCTFIFVGINLHLSIASHYVQASRITRQTIIIYIIGTIIYGSLTSLMIIKSNDRWDTADSVTTVIAFTFIIISVIYTKVKNIKLFDPIMKGIYGLILRVIPQIALALKIFQNGGDGLGLTMVIIFHILTLSRIFQISMSIKEAGWDRNRIGLIIAETGNELSWTLVTIVWLI